MTLEGTAHSENTEAAGIRDPPGTPISRPLALLDAGLDRLGLRGPFARDLALGVLVALVSTGMLLSLQVVAGSSGAAFTPTALTVIAVLACAQSLVLCVRRRAPLLCLSAVVAAQAGMYVFLPGDVAFQGLASFFVAYTCGTLLSLRRLLWTVVAVTAVLGVCGFVFALPPFTSLSPPAEVDGPLVAGVTQALAGLLGFGVVGFVGNDVAARRRFARLERRRAAEAQRERTNNAIRAERALMARELHDIAAHHLSGMVVQTGAAEQLVGRDDRAAREAIAWVRAQGRETLDSLRMVVGALREPGEHPYGTGGGADGAPVPGIAVLGHLVERELALGGNVTLRRTGHAYDLPPVADVTFYRVVQEALANARDHASGAHVCVELHYRESEIVLQVENGPGLEREEAPGHARGLGLIGMRERAELIGAVLRTGATDSGGWRVRLTLPFTRGISADRADHVTAKDAFHDQGGSGG
ncbi:signal transduction histidine kinase [Nocardiopsis arvandica]|uniref:histidine kinase n=1 Tax=Nocardiopsis sinuspersici TaxID=501010 RepID=A0A7Y9XA08_9ACTN|nr:histidine kinase [Nocardiopsis sinuspersici]NYH51132.1 signal transduction histidine kinase [Nocardiopsis sinuspersici]